MIISIVEARVIPGFCVAADMIMSYSLRKNRMRISLIMLHKDYITLLGFDDKQGLHRCLAILNILITLCYICSINKSHRIEVYTQ